MRDYALSKLFFDLQNPKTAAAFRADPEPILGNYPLSDETKKAIADRNVPFLAARTNPYLLRYFFFTIGMKDEEFIPKLRHG